MLRVEFFIAVTDKDKPTEFERSRPETLKSKHFNRRFKDGEFADNKRAAIELYYDIVELVRTSGI